MPTSSKQVFESLSRQVSNTSRGSSGSRTPSQNDEGRHRPSLSPRNPAVIKSQIKLYNDTNNLLDIYAGGEAPARRYATAGSGPAGYRTRRLKAPLSPPKATLIQKRYGSHGPADLAPPNPALTSEEERADPFKAVIRSRPLSTSNVKYVSAYAPELEPNPAVGLNPRISAEPGALLPALPIAGSPGTPTLFSGVKELFHHFDESSGESDAPGDEYRPTAPRKRVKKKNRGSSDEESYIPAAYDTHRYHTPDNLHPRPPPGRPQRYESSSPPPVKRFFSRDPTPTF